MVSTAESRWPRLARHAVQSLHHAVRMLRQHAEHAQLGEAAIERAAKAVLATVAHQALPIHIGNHAVTVADETVRRFQTGEAPFGALAAAGIGELHLSPELTATSLRTLIRLLARAAPNDPGGAALVASLRTAHLTGVQLRAATRADRLQGDTASATWWPLAAPDPRLRGLQPLVERDRDANLPALAAHRLLAVLDTKAEARADLLDPLFCLMLQRGDVATAAWLLGAASHNARVPAAISILLRQRAQLEWNGTWLDRQLLAATPNELRALAAFAIELGDEALLRFFSRAEATSVDLPPELADFGQ